MILSISLEFGMKGSDEVRPKTAATYPPGELPAPLAVGPKQPTPATPPVTKTNPSKTKKVSNHLSNSSGSSSASRRSSLPSSPSVPLSGSSSSSLDSIVNSKNKLASSGTFLKKPVNPDPPSSAQSKEKREAKKGPRQDSSVSTGTLLWTAAGIVAVGAMIGLAWSNRNAS